VMVCPLTVVTIAVKRVACPRQLSLSPRSMCTAAALHPYPHPNPLYPSPTPHPPPPPPMPTPIFTSLPAGDPRACDEAGFREHAH
jgi:hypothetical protein